MEAMNLVEVVLNNEDENEGTNSVGESSAIKGLDESVTITVTRTPGRPAHIIRKTGKPANFAMMSPSKSGRSSDAIRSKPREEMFCSGCDRVFKYKAAFMRHEAQCGLPAAVKEERPAVPEAKMAVKPAEVERRKTEEKPFAFRCPTCLKQFLDNDSFRKHDFDFCASERASYSFACAVCKAKFKYKNHLRRHEDSHNNIRRYTCDVCTTAFLRPDHLKRHMMRMHGIVQLPAQSSFEKSEKKSSLGPQGDPSSDEKNNTKNTPMECPVCSKVLSRRDHLLRHVRNVHHMAFENLKQGGVSENSNQSAGLHKNGGMVFSANGSYQDEDESDCHSRTSHDGLLIDESYDNIKRECESPTHDNSDELGTKDVCKALAQGNVFQGSYQLEESKGHIKVKSDNFLYHQNDGNSHLKVDPKSPISVEGAHSSNGGLIRKNPEVFAQASSGAGTFCSSNDVRMSSFDAETSVPVEKKNEEEMHGKTATKANSDGNQNVLTNGHTSRNASDDWLNDLVGFHGW